MKGWKFALYLLSLPPLVFSIAMLAFFIHESNASAEPQGYYRSDPPMLPILSGYYNILLFTFLTFVYSLVVFLIVGLLYFIFNRKRMEWRPLLICLSSYALGICVCFTNLIEL